MNDPATGITRTTYGYDHAHNRVSKTVTGGAEPGHWVYGYNAANQLHGWTKYTAVNGAVIKSAILVYDANGNRQTQTVTEGPNQTATTYQWDSQNHLSAVTQPDTTRWSYLYDYRTRRYGILRSGGAQASQYTGIAFAGGLSLGEYEYPGADTVQFLSAPAAKSVHYQRGPDMGGGVGGLLYSLRDGAPKFNLSNGRGDIVAQSDSTGALTWTASYEAYGKRTKETGTNADKQRANSKDEDPTGLLNEGFRYRDIETGVWLSRDPAGFVDGPNLYAYVMQNPWTMFDAEGLYAEAGHFYTTYAVAIAAGMDQSRAYRVAYYSQLPDEAAQFDAIDQTKHASKAVGHPVQQMWRHLTGDKAGTEAAGKAVRDMTNVHRKLHFLRGSDDGQIKGSREGLAGAIKGGSFKEDWQLGFAIHTLGDTYAHTKDLGGGKEGGYPTLSGHGEDGIRPDSIGQNAFNSAKYESYVRELFTSLGGKDFDKNSDMQSLLENARSLRPVVRSHETPNNQTHDWFTGHFGERAPLGGYDPRGAGAVDSRLPVPEGKDVEKHMDETEKHLK